jgi:lipopolysaccharide/colanic/teichoic acid biosynthesis glycosyltransferase
MGIANFNINPDVQSSGEISDLYSSISSNIDYQKFFMSKSNGKLRFLSKRVLDVFLSAIFLMTFFPVLLMIAITVKLDSRGGVFFFQDRIGQNLKIFKIIKFRTMRESSNKPTLRSLTNKCAPSEVTRIGRLLRMTSLDELPQFWNVLRGDMSIVGPRALSLEESLDIPPELFIRYSVPVGITGESQLQDRYGTFCPERLRWDVEYAQAGSLLTDISIMLRTPRAMISSAKKTSN